MPFEEALGQVLKATTKEQRDHNEKNGNAEHKPITQATDKTQHGADPDRGSGRQAADVTSGIVQDHPGAEKADTGQDSLDDATHRVVVRRKGAIRRAKDYHGGDSGAKSYERVGAQSGWLAVQLAIQTDNGADNQSRAQAKGSLFVRG